MTIPPLLIKIECLKTCKCKRGARLQSFNFLRIFYFLKRVGRIVLRGCLQKRRTLSFLGNAYNFEWQAKAQMIEDSEKIHLEGII